MRKEVIVIICDVCGREIQENEVSGMKIEYEKIDYKDICQSCSKKILDYIKHINKEMAIDKN